MSVCSRKCPIRKAESIRGAAFALMEACHDVCVTCTVGHGLLDNDTGGRVERSTVMQSNESTLLGVARNLKIAAQKPLQRRSTISHFSVRKPTVELAIDVSSLLTTVSTTIPTVSHSLHSPQ